MENDLAITNGIKEVVEDFLKWRPTSSRLFLVSRTDSNDAKNETYCIDLQREQLQTKEESMLVFLLIP